MKKLFLALLAVALIAPASAQAEVLLEMDLSVTNEVTITATSGLSAATLTDGDGIGIYFDNFFGAAGDSLTNTLVSGDLRVAGSVSDGSPALFRGGAGTDTGLNFWSWTNDASSTFTTGSVAFEGSGTWTVDAATYADFLAGATFGDLYFPADTADDVAGATLIGEFRVGPEVVPEPGSLAILGMAGIACLVRRRR